MITAMKMLAHSLFPAGSNNNSTLVQKESAFSRMVFTKENKTLAEKELSSSNPDRPKPFKTYINQQLLAPTSSIRRDDEYADTWSVINSLFDEG